MKSHIKNLKVRILATNALNFLTDVDEIIMLDNGVIVQKGTYNNLKNSGGPFSDFVANYKFNNDNAESKLYFFS